MKNNILNNSDFKQIAKIHKQELSNSGFISKCNLNFIYIFYKKIYKYTNCYLFTIKKEDTIQGFALFTTIADRYLKTFILNNLIYLFLNPITIYIVIKAILTDKKKEEIFYQNELIYIAVQSKFKRQGFAKRLLEEGEKNFMGKKIYTYYLQVNKSNHYAIEFYKKNQFTIVNNKLNSDKLLLKKELQYE